MKLLMQTIMIWMPVLMFLSVELSYLERTGVQSCSFSRIFSMRIGIKSPLVENCVLVLVQNYLWVQVQPYGEMMIWVLILTFLSAELSFLEQTGVEIRSFGRICSFCIDIRSPSVENCVLVLVQNYLWVR